MELEEFRTGYVFSISEKVQWGDMDAFQHVNNTVYFRYFERVRIAFFEEYGLLDEFSSTAIGPVLASTQCRFIKALEYPDTIQIGTSVSELEADRFLMKYGIYSEQINAIAAKGDGFIIYYDYRNKVKAPMPEAHYRRLQSLAEKDR